VDKEKQVDKVLGALISLNGQASITEILAVIPEVPRESIRRVLQTYCEDSITFLGPGNELFRSVHGLDNRKGIWAIVGNPSPEFEDSDTPAERQLKTSLFIKRNQPIVLKAKAAREYKCQLCPNTPTLPNKERIVEGHHLKPLGNPHNGPDKLENILIVCPNCHVLCDRVAIQLPASLAFSAIPDHVIGIEYINYHNRLFDEKNW
jgi:hypothetical protein